jgi:hypothetical protein
MSATWVSFFRLDLAGFGWIWLDQVGGVKKKWFYLVLPGFAQPNLAQEKCPVFWAQSPKK